MGEGPLWGGGSRKYIFDAVDASLRRLDTDYIDLYQMHAPDPATPIEETMRALDDVVRSGKVRYIGCSNYTGWQVVEAQWVAQSEHLTPFISAQNQYNLLDRRIERDLVPVAEKYGVGVLPYFPLASGFLTGKYRPGKPPPEGTRLAAMGQRAEGVLTRQELRGADAARRLRRSSAATRCSTSRSAGSPATRWVVSVIAGATKPEQVEQNVAAGAWKLTPEEMAEVDKITRRPE